MRSRRLPLPIATSVAIGALAAWAAQESEFARGNDYVNIVGPLHAEISIETADGPKDIMLGVGAVVRRPAKFFQYAEIKTTRVAADAVIGQLLISDTDAVNAGIAEFVEAKSVEHPALADVPVPEFMIARADRAASAETSRVLWLGLLANGLVLAAAFLAATSVAYAATTWIQRRRKGAGA